MNKKNSKKMINSKPSRLGIIFYTTIFILAMFFLFYLVVYAINTIKNANKLKKEGVCTIVTVTDILEKIGKGGYGARVKYIVGDSIVYSSISSGYNTRLKYNAQYWARYLPDKPEFVSLLCDENDLYIPVEDPLKIPSICNCKNEPSLSGK